MTLEVNSAGGVRLHGSALKKSKRGLPGTMISAAHISVFPRIHSLLRAARSLDLLVHHSGNRYPHLAGWRPLNRLSLKTIFAA